MTFNNIYGGVTAPSGFKAGAVAAGIKHSRPDLALLCSDVPAAVAGVFTTNKVFAAPVQICKERVKHGRACAVITNSGNANACTGKQGHADAKKMAELTADSLGLSADDILVCSTGTIGVPMPMDKLEAAIPNVAKALADDGGPSVAEAIMTTDSGPKETALEIEIDGLTVTIGGMSKGAGMIEPNMATMLGYLTTDADVDAEALQKCLSASVTKSFNRITVDGDQSTNDTVLFFANGVARNSTLNSGHKDWDLFAAAVDEVTMRLAMMIVKDGEGATKCVTITTKGSSSQEDALKVCRAVGNSLLVKTSWFGEDPNWGRVIDAVGYSGAEIDQEQIDIYYDDFCAVKDGCSAGSDVIDGISKVIANSEFGITIDLNLGAASDTVYACDCSYEYVKINSEYTT